MVTHMFASSAQLKMSGRTDQVFSNGNKKRVEQKEEDLQRSGGGQQDRKQQELLSCQRKTIPLG